MAIYVQMKQVMDPLDDDAKARLRGHGYSGSGGEHEPLSCLLNDFFLDIDDAADKRPDAGVDFSGMTTTKLGVWLRRSESFSPRARGLATYSAFASSTMSRWRGLCSDASAHGRAVMARLRESSYDPGQCKAKWQGSAKLVGGSYEHIC